MLRPRLPATILTAALSAATFDMVPAAPVEKARDKDKAYSVVGQSTESTAATGRKPLAKRIAAANQPIRTAGPDWQGPQLTDGTVVAAPLADIEGRPADAAPEPGLPLPMDALVVEVPLPTAEVDPAIAAPGRVPEPPLVATLPATPAIDPAPPGDWTSAVVASSDPGAAGTAAADTAIVTPRQPVEPDATARRVAAVPRVQERLTTEADVPATPLLDRVRSTLTRLPRPLGLLPAPHTASSQPPQSQHSHPRHRGAARMAAAPLAAADGPAIDQPAPAAAAPDDAPVLAVTDPVTDHPLAESADPATATDAMADVTAATESGTATNADDDAALVVDEPSGVAAADPAPAESAPATTPCDCETGDPAALVSTETGSAPAETLPQPAPQAAVTHRAHAAARPRADHPTPAPAREALAERLRSAFARMPRPLGLVPMPGGATAHGVGPTQRQPALAASRNRRPAAAATPGGITANSRAVAARDPQAGDAVLTAGERTTDVVETAEGHAVVVDATAAPATTGTPSLLDETVATAEAGATASTDTAAAGDTTMDGSTDHRAAVGTTTPTGTMAAVSPKAHASQHTTHRHAVRQAPAPRTVRDHLQAAFAGMPRPLGLLPAPAGAAHGAPTAARHAQAHRASAARKAAAPTTVATGTHAAGTDSPVAAASGSFPLDGGPSATTAAATEAFGPAAHPDPDAPAIDAAETVERAISTTDTPAPAAPDVVTLQIEGVPDTSRTGEPFELMITIHNGSSKPLANVVATVFFAEGVEPVSAGTWPVRLAPGVIAFDPIAALAAGETLSLPISAVGVAAGDSAFRVTLQSAEMEDSLTADGSLTVAPPPAQ